MSTRHVVSAVLALVALFGCTARDVEVQQAGSAADERVFTPTQYSVADFYKNVNYSDASWSPDRSKILVTSNASGVYNAYVVPAAGGSPTPLTTSTTNAIFAVSYFPADERILYSSDQGGNELSHLYVRNTDGSVKDLTPGTKHLARFIGWSGDNKSFFYATNERDTKFFDVYEMPISDFKRVMIFKNDSSLDVGSVSRDRRWISLVRSRTTSDQDVFLYDTQDKTLKNITPHTGNISNGPVDFSPDNTKLLFLSDSGSEFASLRAFDLASGAKSTVYEQRWDVSYAYYSKGGKYLVVGVNENARSAARLLDAATMQPVTMSAMPSGLVRGIDVAPNDSAITFFATDGSTPNELYAAAIGGTPRRLTDALSPGMKREDLVVPRVASFKSYDSLEISGVLYRPHQASPEAKAPALVMVHGGPGGQAQVGYSALRQALVNHGYAIFDINNRGSSGYGKTFFAMDDRKHGEADLGDVVAAKRLLASTGYVDTSKIGIIGGSYGGYMVLAALTLQPDAFKVGVDLFGPANWIRTLESIPPWWTSFRDALYAEMGDPKSDSARLRRISPLFNADKISKPLMVLQGKNDPRVLQRESDEIVAAVKKRGIPVEYVVFPDEGHGFVKKDNEITGYTKVIEFLDKYLKGSNVVAAAR